MEALVRAWVAGTDGLYRCIGRPPRGTVAAPQPPSALNATAGDGQVALTWTASPTAGVSYQVRRVNADTVVWTGSGTTATITGLTNGTTYNFAVYAVDASGQLSDPSNTATATPAAAPPPTSLTIYGYNWNNSDTSYQTIAGRKSMFGNRVPCVSIYSNPPVGTYNVSTTVAQEGRAAVRFNANGKYTSSQWANSTAALDDMLAWAESIRAGSTVFWVCTHEANKQGALKIPVADYLGIYEQMMTVKQQASLKTGVQLWVTANFMAYQLTGSNWSDSWVPNCEVLTWDMYGNPNAPGSVASGSNKYGTATGKQYGTTYPTVSARLSDMWAITQRTGFASSWGILEINSPLRDWDTDEAGRVAWHKDVLDTFQAPPMTPSVPPKVCLLWEAPSGNNWFQEYGSNATGGSNNPYPNRADSPMWDLWRPYITGTPVGG